jgi:hypothetical protein
LQHAVFLAGGARVADLAVLSGRGPALAIP